MSAEPPTVPTGWIPFDKRTREQSETHERIVAGMPRFRLAGAAGGSTEAKVLLTDFWKLDAVKAALGFPFERFHQITGSCVGAGGGNALVTLMLVELIRLGDRGRIVLPWWPYTYGKSRLRGGLRGRGEGSFGSSFAEAARLDGFLPSDSPGLPTFGHADGVATEGQTELAWSDGAAIPEKYAEAAKPGVVRSAAPVRNSAEAREAIRSGYPITIACGGYVGSARVEGSGAEACARGEIDSDGGHQTSLLGTWDHPTFGPLFWYQNSWHRSFYPSDPAGGAPCGCWITARQADAIFAEGEAYAFSQFADFPAQDISRELFKVFGS